MIQALLLCSNLDIYGNPKDTITIEETSEIQAFFDIEGQCNILDSANVYTSIIGGTPPHSVQWSNGVNTLDNYNLQPNPLLPYSLIITDNNGCQVTKYLKIDPIPSMKTFSSFVGVICKTINLQRLESLLVTVTLHLPLVGLMMILQNL